MYLTGYMRDCESKCQDARQLAFGMDEHAPSVIWLPPMTAFDAPTRDRRHAADRARPTQAHDWTSNAALDRTPVASGLNFVVNGAAVRREAKLRTFRSASNGSHIREAVISNGYFLGNSVFWKPTRIWNTTSFRPCCGMTPQLAVAVHARHDQHEFHARADSVLRWAIFR